MAALKVVEEGTASDAELLEALQTIEESVHFIDYGEDFAKRGGIASVARLLDSSRDDLAAAAASVLGSALQKYCRFISHASPD